jgi:hypothetical protein
MLKSGFLAWNSGYCHSKGFLFLHLTANISEKSAITVNRSEEQSPAPSNDRPPANMDQQTILKAKDFRACLAFLLPNSNIPAIAYLQLLETAQTPA